MSVRINLIRFFTTRWVCNLLLITLVFTFFPAKGLTQTPILRKVIVLYNSDLEQSPVENMVFETCQTILNYYGILTDYYDVTKRPFPDDDTMAQYRGIITSFTSTKMRGAQAYFEWILHQQKNKKKLIILGNLGGTDAIETKPELKILVDEIFAQLGLISKGNFTENQVLLHYDYKDKKMVEFERDYPYYPVSYEQFIPINEDVKTSLSISRADKKNSTSTVIMVSPSGGFVWSGYVLWEDPVDFRKKWYLNPFLFFKKALDLKNVPAPDPTTLNGLRVAFSHVDGDAFMGYTEVDKSLVCAEVVQDYILEKVDFPVTISVIVGEIDLKAVGNQKAIDIAREIFRLPNVEPASHSYSHPYFWDTRFKHKAKYTYRHGIKISGYDFNAKTEVDYSMQYITKDLSPAGKACEVFLWSGNCEPKESDVERVDINNWLNMNGGDTVFDNFYDSYTSVAPLYRQVGKRTQFYCGQANENIVTNLWTGPFYGYNMIITTMKRTGFPYRLKPIDVYYHFYSVEYYSSLHALLNVYKWVLEQDVAKIFTSEYLRMAQGYMSTKLMIDDNGCYVVEDYNNCLTIRFDTKNKIPDLKYCENILGYSQEKTGLYISLVPNTDRAVIKMTDKKSAFRKPDSKGVLLIKDIQNGNLELLYK